MGIEEKDEWNLAKDVHREWIAAGSFDLSGCLNLSRKCI